jgi:RNA polymerase sigma-70 factor (ECF subfamily)
MNDILFDTRSSEMQGDLALWNQLHGDTNSEQLSRLLRQLRQAREKELTPRQRDFLLLYYDQQLSMQAIADQYGVHVSTVSRTLQRGRERLRHVLQYAF